MASIESVDEGSMSEVVTLYYTGRSKWFIYEYQALGVYFVAFTERFGNIVTGSNEDELLMSVATYSRRHRHDVAVVWHVADFVFELPPNY